jgi:hypothetical protein
MLKDQQVTLDLISSGLNQFDVIIWRTDMYTYFHRMYWYVGEHANQATLSKYSADFSSNLADAHGGIVGIGLGFFSEHWPSQALRSVRLVIMLSSDSNDVAPLMISAGAETVIYCVSDVSLEFGMIDDLTSQVVAYLSQGYSVLNSVWTTISPYLSNQPPEDPLDSTYSPPFWYVGNGALTIN